MSKLKYHDLTRYALGFVLEDETWPVFLAWVRVNGVTERAREWLEAADLEKERDDYLRHSPDPSVRAMVAEQ